MLDLSRKTIALIAIASSLVIIATTVVFLVTQVKTAYQLDMHVQVIAEGNTAFDLNTSVVTFGRLKPGGALDRYFQVNNTGTDTVRVVVKPLGTLGSWVRVTPSFFEVTPEERSKDFQASVFIPGDAAPGNYSGRLLVIVMRT